MTRTESPQEKDTSARSRQLFLLVLLGISIFGMTQALARVGESLFQDEPFVANLVRLPWSQFYAMMFRDSPIPLHFVIMKFWTGIFGESEFALRSFSVLCFGGSIFMVGLAGERIAGRAMGWLAALLVAASLNMGQVHGAQARMYALALVFASLNTLVFFDLALIINNRAKRQRQVWDAVLWSIGCAAGTMTHPVYVVFLAAFVAGALLVSPRFFLRIFLSSLVSGIVYLIIMLPLLIATLPLPTTAWLGRPGILELANGIVDLWSRPLTAILCFGVIGAVILRLRRRRTPPPKLTGVLLLVTGLVVILPFLASQVRPIYTADRTPILFLPLVSLCMALVIVHFGKLQLAAIMAAVLVLFSVVTAFQYMTGPGRVGTRSAVEFVIKNVTCQDVLVLGGLSYNEVTYYLRTLHAPDCIQTETFPLSTGQLGWMDVVGLMAHPDQLTAEATSTAQRLAAKPGVRVWLFYGELEPRSFARAVTDLLLPVFNAYLLPVQKVELNGTFFDQVIIYRSRTQ